MDVINIERGSKKDKEDIIHFIDFVFSKASRPHDFASMLPKLFSEGAEKEDLAYIIKADKRIEAVAYAVPLKVSTGSNVCLTGKCIGAVAVDPSGRGKGYMKAIMEKINEDILKEGYDFAVLGGQRQRYEYFDYTPAGFLKNIYISPTNIQHGLKNSNGKKYSFLPLQENEAYLEEAFCLYQHNISRCYGCVRQKAEFVDILNSWYFKPYVILEDNHFTGYCNCFLKEGILQINEICLENPGELLPICKDLFYFAGCSGFDGSCNIKTLMFKLNPYQESLSGELSKICENYTVFGEQAFHIFNYEATVKVLMEKKHQKNQLQDGELLLNIENYGFLQIQIEKGRLAVKKREDSYGDCSENVISVTANQATALLFSIKSEELGINVPSGWFPLKFSISNPDLC